MRSLATALPELGEGHIRATAPLAIEWSAAASGNDGVWELSVTATNQSLEDVELTRIDPLSGRIATRLTDALWFTSRWGAEFEPERSTTDRGLSLSVTAGRSSHGTHPWLALTGDGLALIVSPAWSGNWHIDLELDGSLTAGMSPVGFSTVLRPGASFTAPTVFVALGADLNAAARALTRAVGRDVLPRSPASDAAPVEWNHWWPYEDVEIDEGTFLANVEVARKVGIDVATLDAGWFGRAEAGSDWQRERGDWSNVNTARFPSGLTELASGSRRRGVEFGIWAEGEAVGVDARLRYEHPEILALRAERSALDDHPDITVSKDPDDPTFLGYVCMGSEGGRRHVAAALDRTVTSTRARWLKLDFNVDPGAGCSRTDHGHGAGDGLWAHYVGLYKVLDEFRAAHPEVILEACSSGGLRIDLGLARHVHCFFLSDPDWTEHHLQVLWAASLMLPPAGILHWSWSQWRGDHAAQSRDWERLDEHEFDTMLRAAMLHRFGISLRLPDLSERLLGRLRDHVQVFRSRIAPLVSHGELSRSSDQPLRDGRGVRVAVFQLDRDSVHLAAAFVLDGGERPEALRFQGLRDDAEYVVEQLTDPVPSAVISGSDLMLRGWPLAGEGQTSWLVMAERMSGPSPSV